MPRKLISFFSGSSDLATLRDLYAIFIEKSKEAMGRRDAPGAHPVWRRRLSPARAKTDTGQRSFRPRPDEALRHEPLYESVVREYNLTSAVPPLLPYRRMIRGRRNGWQLLDHGQPPRKESTL